MDALFSRYRTPIFLLFLFCTPIVVWGALTAWKSNSNNVADWLPEEFEETKRLQWFFHRFGGDELLMISWDDCTLEDERVQQLARHLRTPALVDGCETQLFRQVFTGPEVLQALTDAPLDLKKQQALLRMEGWLIGPDRYTTCVLALASPEGSANRHAAVDHVYRCAEQHCGIAREQLHVAGPTMESVAIDRASQQHLDLLTAVSTLVCFGLMAFGLRHFLIGLMVYGTALLCQQMSLALVYYTGSQMDSVLLMLPSLVYVLCISSGVHVANYYRDAIREGGLEGATARAIRYAWTPCWLSSITTSIGLLSLVVSMIVPIRKFGGYASAAVLVGTGIVVLLLPCLLEEFPQRRWAAKVCQTRRRKSRLQWEWLLAGVSKCHVVIVVLAIAILITAGWGVTNLKATARLHNLFHAEARILADYDWLETNVGPLVPIEVVVQIPKESPQTSLERMQFVEDVRHAIDSVEGIDCTVSAATFGPQLPNRDANGWRLATHRAVLTRKLEGSLDKFAETGYVREDRDHELWRISARVRATSNVEYGPLLQSLENHIDPILNAAASQEMPGVSATYCGGVPLVHKAQHQLMDDLIHSFVVAFAIIAVIMMLLLRSIRAGLVSMIPNVLPALAVFGGMGWAGIEIEVGSMLTATAALGIAVDDTLHFIAAFRHGLSAGMSRREAVLSAYRRCGAAMMQTSLICGVGLLVFSFSPFAPIARFAWLMGAMLGAALLGDLLVLPALLLSRLGRVFAPREPVLISAPTRPAAKAA